MDVWKGTCWTQVDFNLATEIVLQKCKPGDVRQYFTMKNDEIWSLFNKNPMNDEELLFCVAHEQG